MTQAEKEKAVAGRNGPSLAKAYWLNGVAANIGISILAEGIWRYELPLGALLAWGAYDIFALWLIWTAAQNYPGRALWRGMARAAVIVSAPMIVVVIVINAGRCGSSLAEAAESGARRLAGAGNTPFEQMALDLADALASSRASAPPKKGKESFEEAFGDLLRKSDADIQTALREAAAALNRTAPRMIDPVTRFDRAVAGPGKTFRTEYTILIPPKTLTSDFLTRVIQGRSRSEKIVQFCTHPDMGVFRRDGVTVSYAYFDRSRKRIGEVSVAASDCNEFNR